jgi:hypothetical protein
VEALFELLDARFLGRFPRGRKYFRYSSSTSPPRNSKPQNEIRFFPAVAPWGGRWAEKEHSIAKYAQAAEESGDAQHAAVFFLSVLLRWLEQYS